MVGAKVNGKLVPAERELQNAGGCTGLPHSCLVFPVHQCWARACSLPAAWLALPADSCLHALFCVCTTPCHMRSLQRWWRWCTTGAHQRRHLLAVMVVLCPQPNELQRWWRWCTTRAPSMPPSSDGTSSGWTQRRCAAVHAAAALRWGQNQGEWRGVQRLPVAHSAAQTGAVLPRPVPLHRRRGPRGTRSPSFCGSMQRWPCTKACRPPAARAACRKGRGPRALTAMRGRCGQDSSGGCRAEVYGARTWDPVQHPLLWAALLTHCGIIHPEWAAQPSHHSLAHRKPSRVGSTALPPLPDSPTHPTYPPNLTPPTCSSHGWSSTAATGRACWRRWPT